MLIQQEFSESLQMARIQNTDMFTNPQCLIEQKNYQPPQVYNITQ